MLNEFLDVNRAELIERCRTKVARRPTPSVGPEPMVHGIPQFLEQLIEALRDQGDPPGPESAVAGPSGLHDSRHEGIGSATRPLPARISATAARHGHELLLRGYTVDQVVHDYGDLCQAVTELANEMDEPISAGDFNILNRCLDDAMADAVTEFGRQRDRMVADAEDHEVGVRLGYLAHELRNLLNTATLAFAAIKGGGVGLNGATSNVLERSLEGLRGLIDRTLSDVRLAAGAPLQLEDVALDQFIADIRVGASLEAATKHCELTVFPVKAQLKMRVDRQMLHSAVSNLLQNAFKYTRTKGTVSLCAYGTGERLLIEIEDQCGGLPEGMTQAIFHPFEQHHEDRSGLGLGLSVARRSVEANGGQLRVRDMPGRGCVFTIDLPRHIAAAAQPALEP